MDQPLRAPWRVVLRYVVFGVGIAAALVLLSLVLGARPASAASAPTPVQSHDRSLVGGVVDGLGDTVHGVAGGVGHTVERVVDPVRTAVAPAAPAPAAPTHAAPAAPTHAAPAAPTQAAPAAPTHAAPAAPAPAAHAPAPALHAPASAQSSSPAPAAPAPATATAPTSAAHAAPADTAPAAPADTAPAALTNTAPVAPTDATTDGPQAGPGEASSASRPVTDTVARVLDPVTGTVPTLADVRPVTTVVHTLDGVVGGVPVVRSVLGDDTLGTVTGPVAGLVDDTLGGVGAVVGSVPQVVTDLPPTVGGVLPGGADPVVDVPTGPVGGRSTTPVASVPPPTASAPHTAGAGARAVVPDPAAHRPASSGSVSVDPAAVASASTVRDATYGGRALLVPMGHGVTFGGPADPSGAGALGGSAAGSAGSTAAVGIVGSDDQVSLAAGSRGTLADDAVPASVVGEHDVAPD